MNGLKNAIKRVLIAHSQAAKSKALKEVSREFYRVCYSAGMKREEILVLSTEIIDCFTEDIKILKEKVICKKH